MRYEVIVQHRLGRWATIGLVHLRLPQDVLPLSVALVNDEVVLYAQHGYRDDMQTESHGFIMVSSDQLFTFPGERPPMRYLGTVTRDNFTLHVLYLGLHEPFVLQTYLDDIIATLPSGSVIAAP